MAMRAASSIMSHTGPGGCGHTRPTRKVGTGKSATTEPDPNWVLTCGVCEPALADHELWGPGNQPAPLTVDEQSALAANQQDANRTMLESFMAMPGLMEQMMKLLQAQNAGK